MWITPKTKWIWLRFIPCPGHKPMNENKIPSSKASKNSSIAWMWTSHMTEQHYTQRFNFIGCMTNQLIHRGIWNVNSRGLCKLLVEDSNLDSLWSLSDINCSEVHTVYSETMELALAKREILSFYRPFYRSLFLLNKNGFEALLSTEMQME